MDAWVFREGTPKAKNFASVIEPSKVAPILRMIDDYDGTLTVHCALRLAPLVFVRPGELRKAEWKDIDLERGEWKYLVTKTEIPHIVPLARQSISGHGFSWQNFFVFAFSDPAIDCHRMKFKNFR